MHCAAGDGIGIIVGAAIGAALTLTFWPDFALEYILGFSFGWGYFQAFAMRDMAGGDYIKSLKMTFLPEFLSMNCLMSGMLLVSKFWMPAVEGASDPARPQFWFIMSISLVAGFAAAYPMNWWMVSNHMKHGMITVLAKERTPEPVMAGPQDMSSAGMTDMDMTGDDMGAPAGGGDEMEMPSAPTSLKVWMIIVSVAVLAITLAIISTYAPGA